MLKSNLSRFAPFATGAALLASSSLATADLTGNLGVTNNYVWRGFTQTNDAPAVSGGLDYSHSSGIYVGTWISNVDFAEPGDGDANSPETLSEYEQDFYAGYAGSAGDFSYDVGYIYWAYPLTRDADFGEVYASVGYSYLTVQANYTTNSQVDDVGTNAFVEGDLYYKATLDVPVYEDLGLSATVGHYEYDLADSYNHYNLYVHKGDFSFGLEQNDADGEFPTGKQADGPRFVVSWGKTFDLL